MTTASTGHIVDEIRARRRESPADAALTFLDQHDHTTMTREDVCKMGVRYATALRRCGSSKDDVIILAIDHGPALPAIFLGALSIGALPCLLPGTGAKLNIEGYLTRLRAAIARLNPQVVVVDDEAIESVQAEEPARRVVGLSELSASDGAESGLAVERSSDDVAFLQLTSGSTGRQKVVPVTHTAVRNFVHARTTALQITAEDVSVGWVPLFHDLGIVGNVLYMLMAGVHSVLVPPFRWLARPVLLMEAVHRYKGTISTMPNFAFDHCVSRITDEQMHGITLDHWRLLCSGAEPVLANSLRRFAQRFRSWGFSHRALAAGYGLAENTLSVTATPPGQLINVDRVDSRVLRERWFARPSPESQSTVQIVSCGSPFVNTTVAIKTDAGVTLAERNVGNVAIKGTSLFNGYFDDRALTTECMRDDWFYTGDLGYMANGELYICGRKKDVIVVSGVNVHAEDVEILAAAVPGLRSGRIVAFGVPDSRGSECVVVVAEVRLGEQPLRSQIERDLRQRVKGALDVTLGRVTFVDAGWIVKTSSGKVARTQNRSKWFAEYGDVRSAEVVV